MEVIAHCPFSRIKSENTTRREMAMAVEIMTVLLERCWVALNCPGRNSLEPLRPLDTGPSCKGNSNVFIPEAEEEEDINLAMKLLNRKKLIPSMEKRTIED